MSSISRYLMQLRERGSFVILPVDKHTYVQRRSSVFVCIALLLQSKPLSLSQTHLSSFLFSSFSISAFSLLFFSHFIPSLSLSLSTRSLLTTPNQPPENAGFPTCTAPISAAVAESSKPSESFLRLSEKFFQFHLKKEG